ncbi:hypothetical protein TDB9533_00789 [Thalassocella blandensis]|nr:hypothetical protein TDB9533_00789 [Thalassocella blandensis]
MCRKQWAAVTIFLMSIILFPISSWAAGWSNVVKMDRIYPRAEGFVFVDLTGAFYNPDNCKNSGWYRLEKSTPGFENIYSALLAATTAKSEIKVYLNGCVGDYPKIQHVIIQ